VAKDYVMYVAHIMNPVGKIAEKAVSRSIFLTTWHCNLREIHFGGLRLNTHYVMYYTKRLYFSSLCVGKP